MRAFSTLVLSAATILVLTCMGGAVSAQDLQPGEVLPELTAERQAERGATNFTGMAMAMIAHAREHGQSPAEAGRFAGEFFALSWGADPVAPARFVSSMHHNWQMYGISTEIVEVGADQVTARRDRMPIDAFLGVYEEYGIAREDVETFFDHLARGITSQTGLAYSETVEGDHIVFTVTSAR